MVVSMCSSGNFLVMSTVALVDPHGSQYQN